MESDDFKKYRALLGKTQKEISTLLGVSLKAVSSYEQGWRSIPTHIERQLLYLLSNRRNSNFKPENCWKILKCPPEKRKSCPAWEFNSGKHCWFINGTICNGTTYATWEKKIKQCYKCRVLQKLIDPEAIDEEQNE